MNGKTREGWGSKLGIIMAVAGSAIGLGNFLRFPVQAAKYGGGAFMIPYFIALIFLGIPLMWVEWTIGRYGGGFGHGTAPGIFHTIWRKNRFIKYFGIIGILGPILIYMWYVYIESWLLGFVVFSATGRLLEAAESRESMIAFLQGYQGITRNEYFSGIYWAYLFLVITCLMNTAIIYKGIKGGIERFCKIAMPTLIILGIILAIRVLTLGTPDPQHPDWNVNNGLGFLWNPDFSKLKEPEVWLAATGQVFFTLSVGIGVILTYASYLKRADDVALSGLTAVSTNTFAEVILGGTIVVTAAYAFFGPAMAKGGAFDLGFITMPMIFKKMAFGQLFAIIWFGLLFLAGITSSISLAQPAIAFLEDELNIDKRTAVTIFTTGTFILSQFPVFFLKNGVLDDLDFISANICLVSFALIEVLLFGWVLGIDRAWEEVHRGAQLKIPSFYKFIMKYITPSILIIFLAWWFKNEGINNLLMRNVAEKDRPVILATRLTVILLVWGLIAMVKLAWQRKEKQEAEEYTAG